MLSFLQADTPSKTVLFLKGELANETAKLFEERVRKIVASSSVPIIIDMHEVRFIDSSGIGAMMSLLYNLKALGRTMQVRRVNPILRIVLNNFLAADELFCDSEQHSGRVLRSKAAAYGK